MPAVKLARGCVMLVEDSCVWEQKWIMMETVNCLLRNSSGQSDANIVKPLGLN